MADGEHEKAVEGLSKLLFAPFYLITEVGTALLPGVLFCLLLVAKGNGLAHAAMGSTLFGYKTKIFLGLFVSYLVGRFFRIPFGLLTSYWVSKFRSGAKQEAEDRELLKNFFIGAMVLPGLLGRSRIFDYFILAYTDILFTLTTGAVLLVASIIPGDGVLRPIELGAGLVFFLVVPVQQRKLLSGLAALLGAGTDLSTFLGPLSKVLTALGAKQAPPPQKKPPADSGPEGGKA